MQDSSTDSYADIYIYKNNLHGSYTGIYIPMDNYVHSLSTIHQKFEEPEHTAQQKSTRPLIRDC